MASSSSVEDAIPGIIHRTSANPSRRHAHLFIPLGSNLPTTVSGDHPLTAAPHFPDITILDAIPCNILYQTSNSSTDFFHVYNFITHSHFLLPFPFPNYVNAAIVAHKCNNFKVLVVCVKETQNWTFVREEGHNNAMPVAFFVYSSERQSWSEVRPPYLITSDELFTNRRKPVHLEEDVVFLDLIDRVLIRFDSMKEQIEPIPKLVCPWENELSRLDDATRYGECRGYLHCVKINRVKERIEIWRIQSNGFWGLAAMGKEGDLRGRKVVGFHPNVGSLVFMRSEASDEILMVDIKRDLEWVVVGGREPNCDQGLEGEISIFWLSQLKLNLQ